MCLVVTYVYNTEVTLHVCEHVCMCMYVCHHVVVLPYTWGQVSNGVWEYMYLSSCTAVKVKVKGMQIIVTHHVPEKWSTLSVVNVPRQPTRNNNPYKPTLNQTLSLVFHRRSWYRTLL